MDVFGELSLIAGATLLVVSVIIWIWNSIRRWRGKANPTPEDKP